MDHVLKSWNDTPDQKGLLTTAQAEADIALQHTGFALSKPGDLANIKLHMTHVIHTLNQNVIAQGPGLGYGVKKAAAGVAAHVGFASGGGDASENVKLQPHRPNEQRYWRWLKRAPRVAGQSDASDALAEAKKVQVLLDHIVNGLDENEDGTVSW